MDMVTGAVAQDGFALPGGDGVRRRARPRTPAGRRGTGAGGLAELSRRGHPSVLLSGPMARRPKPDHRRALELLAASHDGATDAIMRAHGFTIEQMGL